MRFNICVGSGIAAILISSGCATTGPSGSLSHDPDDLYEAVRHVGSDVRQVKGVVALKVKSKDASGQLPAQVEATHPDQAKLEVMNPFGGTEALLTVDGPKYEIEIPRRKEKRKEEGYGSWGGIPLKWATQLFLGRVPHPTPDTFKAAKKTVSPEGVLEVLTEKSLLGDPEKFQYTFKESRGRAWPEKLHWERVGPGSVSVDFEFKDPEEGTGSPTQWEAKSDKGEVKVKWKDRQVSR